MRFQLRGAFVAASPQSKQALDINIDRARPIVEQISDNIRSAIVEGRLEPGARLPSWLDMATQLGVARGTVKAAYERLADEMLVVSAGAAGTRVATRSATRPDSPKAKIKRPLQHMVRGYYLTSMRTGSHEALPEPRLEDDSVPKVRPLAGFEKHVGKNAGSRRYRA